MKKEPREACKALHCFKSRCNLQLLPALFPYRKWISFLFKWISKFSETNKSNWKQLRKTPLEGMIFYSEKERQG